MDTFACFLYNTRGKYSERYFRRILEPFSKSFRPATRKTFEANDGLNNILNLAYRVRFWKTHIAFINAKLEPYLGFLHFVQYGKPSLVCDFQELYRYLIDDHLIGRCQKLRKKDFVLVTDFMMHLRMGKRVHVCKFEADNLAEGLNILFERKVQVPRIRHDSEQTIDTLINEEAYLLAKFLRHERKTWVPRIASLV